MFITLEGGEGSGKTTQSKALAKILREKGKDVVTTREPGGTPEGEAVRNLVMHNKTARWSPMGEVLLMFSARLIHVEQIISPALRDGKIVICDRFTDSTRAYQGYAGGQDVSKIDDLEKITLGGLQPDITFILDIPAKDGLARANSDKWDRFEAKDIKFHEDLRQGYLDIAKNNPKRCHVIDASKDPKSITRQMLDLI